jgi:hypothetical protein
MNGITFMMTKSVVLNVAAVLVQRAWTLMNPDVTHVIRRPQEPHPSRARHEHGGHAGLSLTEEAKRGRAVAHASSS